MSAGAPLQASAPAPGQPGLSPVARVVNIFIAPSKTFDDLKRSANWILPFLIIAVFSVLFSYAVDVKIGYDKVSENQVKLNSKSMEQLEKLPPDQRAQRMEIGAKFSRYISYGFPVVILVGYLILAAVLMGTFNFGFGAEVQFSVALAIVIFASLPGTLRAILGIISVYAGVDPDGFMIQNPVATNLAGLVDITAHPALYSLLSGFDVLKFWCLILTGIGFACVSKVKRGTAIGVVFGWYFALVLVGAGMAAAFS